MNKVVLIFDYFKEAFHINKGNKSLYKPQIALIALKVILILFVGIGVYSWIGIENINAMAAMRPDQILGFGLGLGLKLIAILLAYALASVVVEAGLLNMYKKAVTVGYTETGDFKEGLSKYFLKILLGEILIVICYILSLPFYLILGVITLTVGLTLIPVIVGVFLSMWKVSLVMNDTGIVAAIKDSFGFAKRNFIPLAVLQVIHWAFAQGSNSGGGGGGGGNIPNSSSFNQGNGSGFDSGMFEGFYDIPGVKEGFGMAVDIVKVVVAVLIPVVSIATIAISIIGMVFEVFFSLTLFVAYRNDFKIEEITEAPAEDLVIPEPLPSTQESDDLLVDAEDDGKEVEQ